MAFIYKRGKIYYVAFRVTALDKNGKKIRKQVSEAVSPEKIVAEEYRARKTISAFSEKRNIVKKHVPIQEFYNEYRKNHSIKSKRESTIKRDDLLWEHFKKICPEVKYAEQFNDSTVNNFINKKLQTVKRNGQKIRKASINRDISTLKAILRWGYKHKYLDSNFYDLIDKFYEDDSQKKRPFTNDEIQKIIDNTSYPQKEAHILSIWHGMRAGEIRALECSDFVWAKNPQDERDYIKIRNKPHLNKFVKNNSSQRDVPIHPMWKQHLFNVWLKAKKKSNFFLLTHLNEPLSKGGLSSYTRRLFTKLQLPKEVSFHSGRHTYATRIKDGGGSIYIASKSLGHSSTIITESVYTEFKPHEHFNVVDFINIPIKTKNKASRMKEQDKKNTYDNNYKTDNKALKE
ncbi:MAG: tyrosine-type recombinase/integrase [Endomicrobium sp.]|jgi:integrase/recombinase XerD|nr:tyrosine-type recombinase/integrase [Endomicrobium sp.]